MSGGKIEMPKEKKCVKCGKCKQYDSNGLCSVCNYQKMLTGK